MKMILPLIFSPLWIIGWVIGFLFVPFWNGLVAGTQFLIVKEQTRVSKIAEEEQAKRGLSNEDIIPSDTQEGPIHLDG